MCRAGGASLLDELEANPVYLVVWHSRHRLTLLSLLRNGSGCFTANGGALGWSRALRHHRVDLLAWHHCHTAEAVVLQIDSTEDSASLKKMMRVQQPRIPVLIGEIRFLASRVRLHRQGGWQFRQ